MEALKKIFPLSWKYTKDVPNLIIGILVYILVGFVASIAIGVATFIGNILPIVGGIIAWLLGIVGSLIGVYVLAGIIIQILVFTKVI